MAARSNIVVAGRHQAEREACLALAHNTRMGAGAQSRGYTGVVPSAQTYFEYVAPSTAGAEVRSKALAVACSSAPNGIRADVACKTAAEYVHFLEAT